MLACCSRPAQPRAHRHDPQGQAGVLQEYEGKVAQVRGVVRLYRGKPEIVLNDPEQLTAGLIR